MTTATAFDTTVPLVGARYHYLLRRLHSLTGIVFGSYLIVHLVVNSTIAQRGTVYQEQVSKIHSLAWLPVIEWVFIYLPIIYHAVYGTWIIFTGRPNVGRYPYYRNWFYLLQRISAGYLIGFILFHVLALKYGLFGQSLAFDATNAQRTIVIHLHTAPVAMWIVYSLGILAAAYHTANGFWTAAITWGLAVSAGGQRRWGYLCAVLGVLLAVAGFVALVAAGTQPVPPATGLAHVAMAN